MSNPGHHFVAVIGGAVSGSVAAEILADHGIRVAVIEQNTRPYGKIEDGLPRWHVEQRKQEYARIDARMKKPDVYFVPSTKVGEEFDFHEFCNKWGFSAVILANGAWRDRDLGVPGADKYVDKGLIYQNPFIYWYNHKNEKIYPDRATKRPTKPWWSAAGWPRSTWSRCCSSKITNALSRLAAFRPDMHELEKGHSGRSAKRTASSRKSLA